MILKIPGNLHHVNRFLDHEITNSWRPKLDFSNNNFAIPGNPNDIFEPENSIQFTNYWQSKRDFWPSELSRKHKLLAT